MKNETATTRIHLGDTPLAKCYKVLEYYNKDNPNINKFLSIMDRTIELSRSTLSFSSVVANSKAFDIDVQNILLPLFKQFTEVCTLLGAIEPIASIDEQIFSIY